MLNLLLVFFPRSGQDFQCSRTQMLVLFRWFRLGKSSTDKLPKSGQDFRCFRRQMAMLVLFRLFLLGKSSTDILPRSGQDFQWFRTQKLILVIDVFRWTRVRPRNCRDRGKIFSVWEIGVRFLVFSNEDARPKNSVVQKFDCQVAEMDRGKIFSVSEGRY